MFFAISNGSDQLLVFALSKGSETANGGDASIAPVLMYVPNPIPSREGAFIEIFRGVPPEARNVGTSSSESDAQSGSGDAFAPPLVHAYQITVVERAAQRRLVYTSARSHAFATLTRCDDAKTRHATPRDVRLATGARVPAGDLFGSTIAIEVNPI